MVNTTTFISVYLTMESKRFYLILIQKVKFSLEKATKYQMECTCTYLYSFFNHDPSLEWVLKATPQLLYTRTQYPALESVWTGTGKLVLTETRSSVLPARSDLLY
jgi:hypothetical protein